VRPADLRERPQVGDNRRTGTRGRGEESVRERLSQRKAEKSSSLSIVTMVQRVIDFHDTWLGPWKINAYVLISYMIKWMIERRRLPQESK
jgi:hypothetical protein